MKNSKLSTRFMATLIAIFFGCNITSSQLLPKPIQVMGESETTYDARSTFQANNVRYDGGWANSIQTNWEADEFPANIADMSYGRVILNAETSKTYTLQVWYATGNAYPLRVFTNGVAADYELAATDWANTLGNITDIALNEGHNVFIIAMLKWGVINGLVTPSGVTVVKEDSSSGVYQASNAQLLKTKLHVASETIHDHDAVIYTQPLEYNSDSDYASKVKFIVDASETVQSIELAYHNTNNTDGKATLQVAINGEDGFPVEFYETANDVIAVKTIMTEVLNDNGFLSNQVNTIEIIKPANNNDSIGLVSLTLLNYETETYTTARHEAEDATLNGGKVEAGDAGKWSNDGYVGDMGTKAPLTSASQINGDLSNVNSLSLTYAAAESGTYYMYLRYATGVDSVAYMRADVGAWAEVSLLSTTWWDTCRVAVVELSMNEGERTITLTGTTNAGGWVNYDFIDITRKGSISASEIAYNYALFFRDKTAAGCSAQDVNLIPWVQLKTEYLTLPDDAKDVFVVSADEIITDARARYAVLITKYATLAADNWLVDGDGTALYPVGSNEIAAASPISPLTIIMIIGVALGALTFVFSLWRRREVTRPTN